MSGWARSLPFVEGCEAGLPLKCGEGTASCDVSVWARSVSLVGCVAGLPLKCGEVDDVAFFVEEDVAGCLSGISEEIGGVGGVGVVSGEVSEIIMGEGVRCRSREKSVGWAAGGVANCWSLGISAGTAVEDTLGVVMSGYSWTRGESIAMSGMVRHSGLVLGELPICAGGASGPDRVTGVAPVAGVTVSAGGAGPSGGWSSFGMVSVGLQPPEVAVGRAGDALVSVEDDGCSVVVAVAGATRSDTQYCVPSVGVVGSAMSSSSSGVAYSSSEPPLVKNRYAPCIKPRTTSRKL